MGSANLWAGRFIVMGVLLGLTSLLTVIFSGLIPTFISPIPSKAIHTIVNESMAGTQGTYSVVIKNLKNHESYFREDHKEYTAGSLYKLWVMAVVMQKLQNGELKETEVLSDSIAGLNRKFEISADVAELTSGGITQSIKNALEQMITISHNYAALLLTDKIKLSTVAKFLEDNGFKESKIGVDDGTPVTTASDISLFFEKLYKGELANPEYTKKMMELLERQKKNNKLPLFLPAGTRIAHKTGELGMFSHDAGIVLREKGDYIIVVLSESKSPAGAEERIGQLSKAVYDYFEN